MATDFKKSKLAGLAISALVIVLGSSASAQENWPLSIKPICSSLLGSAVVAQDGTFLGTISSPYETNSIFNTYGDYGSSYTDNSIWNKFGDYGGEYGNHSPFSKIIATPPIIIQNKVQIAYLTVAKGVAFSVSPYLLQACQF